MRDSREIRYYANIPKVLLLLIGSGAFIVLGWSMLGSGGNMVIAWLAMIFFGLCALVALAMLVFAVVLRQPLLLLDADGVTARQALTPWKKAFVPWPDIARIGVRTVSGARGSSSSTLLVYVRDRNRYTSSRAQRFTAAIDPTLQGVALSAQFTFLLTWASRKRCLTVLERIKTTFAPEIIQYDIAVDA